MAAVLQAVVRVDRRMAAMGKVKFTREMVERIEKALDERKSSTSPKGDERRRSSRSASPPAGGAAVTGRSFKPKG